MVFRRMVAQNHLFLEKKMVSNQKTIFFSRKPKKQKKKKKKKNIFSKTMGLGPPKDGFFGFFGFLEKKMVFWFETIFFSRKRWFYQEKTSKNHLFLEKKMVSNQKKHLFLEKTKKTSFGGPSPIVLEKMVFLVFFWFFWFFGFWFVVSFLFCCCSLDLARTRMPPAVGPLGGGGGEHIYIYIFMKGI